MIHWWTDTDDAIIECLRAAGPMSPEDLARRTGLSLGEIGAFLAMLVRENRVRVRLVELTPEEAGRVTRRQIPVSMPWRAVPGFGLVGHPGEIAPANGAYRCLCCGAVLWHVRRGRRFPECPTQDCPTLWLWYP